MSIKRFKYVLPLTALITLCTDKAFAYIDPNTGGFFFTTVLPFVYGILAAIVIFWKRIVLFVKNFISRLYKKPL